MAPDIKGPVILCVLDGFGIGRDCACNAIKVSGADNIQRFINGYPNISLNCSGEAVGLPEGQMGNSEVGHLTMGAGRTIFQELPRITRDIVSGEFFKNHVLVDAMEKCRESSLHLIGLVSDGGVHSHINHLLALIKMASMRNIKRVYIHCLMDGRDTPPNSGIAYMRKLTDSLKSNSCAWIKSIIGRYYTMDRDNRWDRVQKGYRLMTEGEGEAFADPVSAMKSAYETGETDEFISPIWIGSKDEGLITDGDGIIFFNFRADRARQIARAFNDEPFTYFSRKGISLSTYTTFTKYNENFNFPVAFENMPPVNTLGEIVSRSGKTQLRIAETEKYAHVTFFFNGGIEKGFAGEERILIPSPKVPTYDQKPEMSAPEVTENLLSVMGNFNFILLNFANLDMVGHTGNMDAACEAVRVIDRSLGMITEKALSLNGVLIITADHGNVEQMKEDDGITPHTQHTLNKVPFVLISSPAIKLKEENHYGLSSIAPTILNIMNIPVPGEMTGESLLK